MANQTTKRAYSVSQVNDYIAGLLRDEPILQRLRVEGEVSNVKHHSTGHVYFTLKDKTSQIAAVMWKSSVPKGLTFPLRDGDKVVVSGRIDLYPPQGKYQIIATSIEKAGLGELYVRFEALKNELREMGMFDSMYKKPIPKYPKRVGIITAPTGAAVRDIIQISKRRNPFVELVLFPALVQGEGATQSVATAIEYMDQAGFDVLIVGRGGGSLEDLWAFNEEQVARAIFQAETPIISAVGHETDTTIADFVADLRAPTPSAAAELAVPLFSDMEERLLNDRMLLLRQMQDRLQQERIRTQNLEQRLRLRSPENALNLKRQMAVSMADRLEERMKAAILGARQRANPLSSRMEYSFSKSLQNAKMRLSVDAMKLDGLSPLKKFEAGYAYPSDEKGKPLHSAKDVEVGQKITLRLVDGKLDATVDGVEVLDG